MTSKVEVKLDASATDGYVKVDGVEILCENLSFNATATKGTNAYIGLSLFDSDIDLETNNLTINNINCPLGLELSILDYFKDKYKLICETEEKEKMKKETTINTDVAREEIHDICNEIKRMVFNSTDFAKLKRDLLEMTTSLKDD